jgi:hypothetical protein
MQIREKGNRIIFIRTKYDPDVKRGVSKQIGSMDIHRRSIPDDIKPLLDDDEMGQLEQYLTDKKASEAAWTKACRIAQAESSLKGLVAAIDDPKSAMDLTEARAQAIWTQISELQKALKRAGHKRKPKTEAM